MSSHVLKRWEPENPGFWQETGSRVAYRNLWISIPALMLAFSVWMLWSVVVVNLDKAGFQLSKNQMFWLTALPALSGATLRIFYSFLVPVFGGRRWTAISTASPGARWIWWRGRISPRGSSRHRSRRATRPGWSPTWPGPSRTSTPPA